MFRNFDVFSNPLSLGSASAALVVVWLVAGQIATVAAQTGPGEGSADRAPVESTQAPLPTRERILSDPFLREALSRSTEGLKVTRKPDGSWVVDLKGRFQSISSARIDDEGEIETRCSETHESLADFLAAHALRGGSLAPDEPEHAELQDE